MRKTDALLLVLGFMVPLCALCGVLISFAMRRQRQRKQQTIERVAREFGVQQLGTITVGSRPGPVPGFEHQDQDGRFKVFPFHRGSYEYVEIQLVTEATLPLAVFRRERPLDRLGRALLLNREVQLGDRDFDNQVYIESDEAPEHVRAALADPRVREGVLAAVRLGRAVTFSRHGVSVVLPIVGKVPAAEQIHQYVATLRELASGLRSVSGAVGVWQGAPGDRLIAVAWALMLACYLFSVIGGDIKPSLWEPLHSTGQRLPKQLGAAGVLLCLIGGFVYIRGHSRSLRNYLLFLLPMLLAAPFLPSMVLWGANAAFDRAPLSSVTGTLLEASVKRGSKRSLYRIKIALDKDRPPPQYIDYKTISIHVPAGVYRSLTVGDRVLVLMHRGAFGWPYVGAARRLPP